MFSGKITVFSTICLLIVFANTGFAQQTWHLGQTGKWQQVNKPQAEYISEIAGIKRLINEGKTKQVRRQIRELEDKYPELSGPDFEIFSTAEILYSEGKFNKAVREYERLLSDYPQSDLYQAAIERLFSIGTAYLEGKKKKFFFFRLKGYSTGEQIMEKIADYAGSGLISARALIAIAQSLEKREKYEQAYLRWSEVHSRWSTGRLGAESLLGMARSKYLAYKGPHYDDSPLLSARSFYKEFIMKYPERSENRDLHQRIEKIDRQMAKKKYTVASYYDRTGSQQAANLYYQLVIDRWPQSHAAELAQQKMNQ